MPLANVKPFPLGGEGAASGTSIWVKLPPERRKPWFPKNGVYNSGRLDDDQPSKFTAPASRPGISPRSGAVPSRPRQPSRQAHEKRTVARVGRVAGRTEGG